MSQQQQERRFTILLGGIRLLGCWAAAAEPQLEIARVIPFLIREVWEEEVDSKGASGTDLPLLQTSEQSAFDFLYPALLQLSITSPSTRRWLFSNPPQDESHPATRDALAIGADRSVAASVAMQLVRSGGDLERRRLEFLLNILCLEQADGIPDAVASALGKAAEALATTLMSRKLCETVSIDVALAMAFVAATVRLLRDTKHTPSAELHSLAKTGCGLTVRWLLSSYVEVVKTIHGCSDGPVEFEEANEVPELWSLTCGILSSLSDTSKVAASDLVANVLRASASNCQQLLCTAQAMARKECRRAAQEVEEEDAGPATTAFSVARSLLDLVDRLE